jgi:hypothetical protein
MEILDGWHHMLCMQFFPKGYWKKDNFNHLLATFILNGMHGNLDYFERKELKAKPNNFPMLGPK